VPSAGFRSIFLRSSARWRPDAIFYFGQIVDTDAMIVSYLKPHPSLALTGSTCPSPIGFNDVTRLSRGLLYHGFEEMGFKNIIQLPWSDEWLSPFSTSISSRRIWKARPVPKSSKPGSSTRNLPKVLPT